LVHKKISKCSAVAEVGDRLATIDMGQKLGAVPLLGGAGLLGPIQHNEAWTYLHTKLYMLGYITQCCSEAVT